MTIEAKIILDSVNTNGVRITTMQLKYHRFIHSEVMTHRVFSRNAASSRAIPVAKMIEQVLTDPATPVHWGKNQAGMQAREELSGTSLEYSQHYWRTAAQLASATAQNMVKENCHKQIVNRILEPFQWMHVVVTSTEWDNFYELRDHPDAQPEIQVLAKVMRAAHDASTPTQLAEGEWHIPYVSTSEIVEYSVKDCLKFSAARCARVSYLNHDQSSPTPYKDIELHDKLVLSKPAHMSPVEHQAQSRIDDKFYANFRGWKQYRKYLEEM